MVKWEDSNHLMLVFQTKIHAITALYKDPMKVPNSVKELLKSQHTTRDTFQLRDYTTMSPAELLGVIQKIATSTAESIDKSYALTTDNLLKMVLILLRVRAHIPVLIMGATGCGKTSLIKFLAHISGSKFAHMDFHAGIQESNIIQFISDMSSRARADQAQMWWVFLDEINTCDHMGLINELMCSHSLLGVQLPINMILLAACNPYKKRKKIQFTAGLQEKIKTDNKSDLVYRVELLPESLADLVWDYGALEASEERQYIQSVVVSSGCSDYALFTSLIAESQEFIRKYDLPESVSMRDVKRCIKLWHFFTKHRIVRDLESFHAKPGNAKPRDAKLTKNQKKKKSKRKQKQRTSEAKQSQEQIEHVPPPVVPIILALAICYHTRLGSVELRLHYRQKMIQIFQVHRVSILEKEFLHVILWEQYGYLEPMQVPKGTALNTALLENVFVMVVCILNKIPIFIVGKPGCSKSLSMQLINSNLRGPDSPNPFFKNKPQVYVIAFQGSESSTSDGIIKVFEKAKRYKETTENVIPVVLLDEVGLAETSKANPLKVLHGLIEPSYPKEELDIAVVGISNWALDAAKMNRGIQLSRPDPDPEDLLNTAKAIQNTFGAEGVEKTLKSIAQAYYNYIQYQKNGAHKNFHGMRDFYSLVKCIAADPEESEELIKFMKAIERNFGGQKKELEKILGLFFAECQLRIPDDRTPVLELIGANLEDTNARHLMIILSGDSAVGVVEQQLKRDTDKPPMIIYGSKFAEDRSEEYNYRILSQIILCMETGRLLLLKDLEDTYGSLYDMLNQNYTYVGSKRNCRIALGPYSNPMCQVADGFRCVVLVDIKQIDYTDPPFLNRFEKQRFLYTDIIPSAMLPVLTEVKHWVDGVTAGHDDFDVRDTFMGFNDNTVASLVQYSSTLSTEKGEVLELCKQNLITIATADGVVRASSSPFAKTDATQVKRWQDKYFSSLMNQSLPHFIEFVCDQNNDGKPNNYRDSHGIKATILTYSPIHIPIPPLVAPLCKPDQVQVYKVGTFPSERQLSDHIQAFFSTPKHQLLVLQCDYVLDAHHILLTKSTVDWARSEFNHQNKHVLLIIHMHREPRSNVLGEYHLTFGSGWNMVSIESLGQPQVFLREILNVPAADIINNSILPFEEQIKQAINWAFMCIKYPINTSEQLHNILLKKDIIKNSAVMMDALKEKITPLLPHSADIHAAIAGQKRTLLRHSTFLDALMDHVKSSVAYPLAKYIFVLEKYSALWTFLNNPQLHHEWFQLFNDPKIVDISHIVDPRGPECYTLRTSYKLLFPFSHYFYQQLEACKTFFREDTKRLEQNEDNFDVSSGTLSQTALSLQRDRMQEMVTTKIIEHDVLFKTHFELFFMDFITIKFNSFGLLGDNEVAKRNLKTIMERRMKISHPIELFICWWCHEELFTVIMQMFYYNRDTIGDENYEESTLVQTLCKALLPSTENLSSFGSISDWQRHLNSTLAKLPFLQIQLPPIVHILRICNDFVSCIVNPSSSLLCDLSSALLSAEIGSFQWVQDVFRLIKDVKSKVTSESAQLNQFICSFIIRAQALTSGDHIAQTAVIKFITEGEVVNFAATAVLNMCYNMHEELVAAIAEEDDKEPELSILNDVLVDSLTRYKTEDNPFASLCCDCFSSILVNHIISIDGDLENFEMAATTLTKEDAPPILTVICVSFAKQYIHQLVQIIRNNSDIPLIILGRINAQMSGKIPRLEALRTYVVKCLGENLSILEIQSVCSLKKNIFPWLGTLDWLADVPSAMPYDVFSTYEHYSDFDSAFINAMKRENNAELEVFLKECPSSPKFVRAALGYLASRIYFTNCARSLKPQEYKVLEYIRSSPSLAALPQEVQVIKGMLVSNFNGVKLMELRPNTNSPQAHIASVAVHLLIELATNPILQLAPFFIYAFVSCNLNNQFLLAACEDMQSMALKALGEQGLGHVRYKCTCGYIYFVGNCGQTSQISTCPQCRNRVGGENHAIQPGHIKIDDKPTTTVASTCTPGLTILDSPNIPASKSHSVREMNPVLYRILHFLTNLSLYLGSTLQSSQGATNHLPVSPDYFEQHVKNDWEALLSLLNQNERGLCGIFHTIIIQMIERISEFSTTNSLVNEKSRDEWERRFNACVVMDVINNATNAGHELQSIIAHSATTTEGVFEKEICEQVENMSTEYRDKYLPYMFRVTSVPSFKDMQMQVLNNPTIAKRYPFLELYFRMESTLGNIKNLLPIVEWSQIVTSKLSHRIDRSEAQKMTVADFIKKDAKVLQPLFTRFQQAWDCIRGNVKHYQCHEFKEMPVITSGTSIAFCCAATKDEGVYICGAFEYLAKLQNDFLNSVITLAASGCQSVLYLKTSDTEATLRACPIYDIRESDVVVYEWNDTILKFAQPNLKLGRGREVVCNFYKIEMELAHSLVSGKSLIDTQDVGGFVFNGELFHGLTTILQDVRDKVKQEKLPKSRVESLIRDNVVSSDANNILASLSLVMTFLKSSGAKDSTQTVGEYCKVWQFAPTDIVILKTASINDIQLQFLVSLYEEVEDIAATTVNKYIPKAYTRSIESDRIKNEISKLAIPVQENLSTALKRFMFRFLSIEQISANAPLRDYVPNLILCMPPDGKVTEEDLSGQLPADAYVAHTNAVFQLLCSNTSAQKKARPSVDTRRTTARNRNQAFDSM